MGFRYIHVFDHLNYKLTVSFLDEVFIIFLNKYAITLNQRLCGFNFVVIFLIISVEFVLILIIVHLRCHIENPSIEGNRPKRTIIGNIVKRWDCQPHSTMT